MMIKNFLHFNRGQKIGILIMLGLIVTSLLAGWMLPRFVQPNTATTDTSFLTEAAKFKESLVELERAKQNRYPDYDNFYKPYPKKTFEKEKYELFAFDPNSADSATLVRLGLKPYVAVNILRYRVKGGKFRKPEDFARVYGITPEKFEELKPFISFESNIAKVADENFSETENQEIKPEKKNLKNGIAIELNTADTAAMLQITGIGPSTARGIARYRNLLGGYHSIEQLKEVYGMRPENFERIRSNFTIDDSQIKKINVNTASVDRLKKHPYIKTFQKAVAIYEYRRKKVKLSGIEDLKVLDELTGEDLSKLAPYLEFK